MAKVRPLNEQKYQISKHRFLELYHFCLQYNEWKDMLKQHTDTIKSTNFDGQPRGAMTTDRTANLAIKRAEWQRKCEVVEQSAIEADAELYPYILKAVTNEDVPFNYLKMVMNIPCSHNTYYDRRRKFYWILSQKI